MPDNPSARGYASGAANSSLGLLPNIGLITATGNNGVNVGTTNSSGSFSISIGLGDITPASVNASGTIQGSNLSGTNTGDITLAGENFLSISAQVLTVHSVNLAGSNVTGTLPYTKGGTGLSAIGIANRVLSVNPSATALAYTYAINQSLQDIDTVVFANFSGSSSGTNTGNVTLAGQNYLSISTQTITANSIDLSGSNVSGIIATARLPAGSKPPTTADLTGQTAGVSSVVASTAPNDGSSHQYRLGAYVNITAVTLDVLVLQATYTDENNAAQTVSFFPMGLTSANLASTGVFSFPDTTIRVKPNTLITILANLTTGTGSIAYDVGGNITQLN